jgi:hypothetical protein
MGFSRDLSLGTIIWIYYFNIIVIYLILYVYHLVIFLMSSAMMVWISSIFLKLKWSIQLTQIFFSYENHFERVRSTIYALKIKN